MQEELKYIKKKFGERFMHLCRSNFSTILENPGLLTEILLNNFEPSRFLYDDLVNNDLVDEFVSFIYNNSALRKEEKDVRRKTNSPYSLMKKAGYTLYKCETEEDIQSFKKYYAPGEALCTFYGGRLDECYVYFAVKDNVDKIERKNFKNPKREDKYGTSVISIQFNKYNYHLSIKNRYNHRVFNPDATFSNNLENIIPGLSKSFEKELNICINKASALEFEIPGYVKATDNKHYKYNYELSTVYYCPNNIIIRDYIPIKYDKSKYFLFETYLIDFENKIVKPLRLNNIGDLGNYKYEKINIEKTDNGKIINIDDKFIIEVDNSNRMIKYTDCVTKKIGQMFLYESRKIKSLTMPNVEEIHGLVFNYNKELEEYNFPNVREIYKDFGMGKRLKQIYLPKLERVGYGFLSGCRLLEEVVLPNLKEVGYDFLCDSPNVKFLYVPKLESFKSTYLTAANKLELLELREDILNSFVYGNAVLRDRYAGKKNPKTKKLEKSLTIIRNKKV